MINICLCFDSHLQHYYKHVIRSIKANTESECKFFIISDTKIDNNTIIFKDRIDVIPEGDVKSKGQYYRLYIPELIDVDKILYFDNDVVLNADIQELWNIDLKDNYIGAVKDCFGHSLQLSQSYQGYITSKEFDLTQPVYLSGQLIINCKAWRENNVREQVMDIVKKYRVCDLIAINIVCKDKILELDKAWSMPAGYYDRNGICREDKLKDIDYKKPKLMHYHGINNKPWMNSNVFGIEKYLKYFK